MKRALVLELNTPVGLLRQTMEIKYPVKRAFQELEDFRVSGLPGARRQHWSGLLEGVGYMHVWGLTVSPKIREVDGLYTYNCDGTLKSFTPINDLEQTIPDFVRCLND